MKGKKLPKLLADFTKAMEQRLQEKQSKGFSGWDSENWNSWNIPERLWIKVLRVRDHGKGCGKKCLVDIANFAMFLWSKLDEEIK